MVLCEKAAYDTFPEYVMWAAECAFRRGVDVRILCKTDGRCQSATSLAYQNLSGFTRAGYIRIPATFAVVDGVGFRFCAGTGQAASATMNNPHLAKQLTSVFDGLWWGRPAGAR